MALSDLAVRSAKPQLKEFKLSDSEGLYLLVRPNGSKVWNLAYRFAKKQKKLTIGDYPMVGLADAREHRSAAKKLLQAGKDPLIEKKRAKSPTRFRDQASRGPTRPQKGGEVRAS